MPLQISARCLKKRLPAARCSIGSNDDCISAAQRPGTAQAVVANALAHSPLSGIYHSLVTLAAPSPGHCHDVSLAAAHESTMNYNCSTKVAAIIYPLEIS